MTDRDRLIELIEQAKEKAKGTLGSMNNGFGAWYADHLLANGVIVPPVEAGQTVWYVDDFVEEIEECKVYGFNVVNGKFSLLVDNGECKFITRKWYNTKEEAEKALTERSKNNAR